MHHFWPVEKLAELVDGPTGYGDMASGGYSFTLNFSVTRSAVSAETERRTRPNMMLLLH